MGIESEAELLDFETAVALEPESLGKRLDAAMPAGLRVLGVWALPVAGRSLTALLDRAEYRAWINTDRRRLLPEEFSGLADELFHTPGWQQSQIAAFLARPSCEVERRVKGTVKTIDVRPWVREIEYRPESREVHLALGLGPQGQARPQEVLAAVYGLPGTCFRLRRVALSTERHAMPVQWAVSV